MTIILLPLELIQGFDGDALYVITNFGTIEKQQFLPSTIYTLEAHRSSIKI